MQDELKQVISQAMNNSSNFEQEPIEQIAEGELSDEALEAVAGGRCRNHSRDYDCVLTYLWRNANKLGQA